MDIKTAFTTVLNISKNWSLTPDETKAVNILKLICNENTEVSLSANMLDEEDINQDDNSSSVNFNDVEGDFEKLSVAHKMSRLILEGNELGAIELGLFEHTQGDISRELTLTFTENLGSIKKALKVNCSSISRIRNSNFQEDFSGPDCIKVWRKMVERDQPTWSNLIDEDTGDIISRYRDGSFSGP